MTTEAQALAPAVPTLRQRRTFIYEFITYFFASAAGLAADAGTLILLVELFGAPPVAASVAGFLMGVIVVYSISVRFAFEVRNMRNRNLELVIFTVVGLGGLGITAGVMWLGVQYFVFDYRLVKLAAAALSFLFNFGFRKLLLFRQK